MIITSMQLFITWLSLALGAAIYCAFFGSAELFICAGYFYSSAILAVYVIAKKNR